MAIAASRTETLSALRPESHRLAFAGLGIATIGWASAFIVGKFVLAEMTPLAVATWRYAFASLMLFPFALRGGGRPPLVPVTTAVPSTSPWQGVFSVLFPLGVMIVAGGVLYPWLFLGALSRTSATNTSLLIALNPVLTLVLTPLIGERFERRRMLGAAVAFVGAIVVITAGNPARLAALELNAGDILAVIAAACWASFNLASRSVVGRIAPSVANFAVYVGGFVALFLLAEDPVAQLAHATPFAIAGIAAMALLSSVIAGQLFLIGVRATGVGRAVVFVYLVPVLTAALSVAFLDEPFTIAQLAGGCGVLAGLWLATDA